VTWRAFAALLVITLAVAGCGASSATPSPVVATPTVAASPSDSPAPSDSASDEPSGPIVPESPVAGIVVAVDSVGLDQVKGFTLRTNDGETIDFTLGTLENGTEFPPGHLKEHQTTASPVLVFFREENGALVVYRIEDAG
jgi:hypothetical protein